MGIDIEPSIWIVVVIIVVFLCLLFIGEMIKKKKQNEIRQRCTPRKGKVVDFFITLSVNIKVNNRTGGNTNDWSFYPIIKDELTEKLYISYGNFDYSSSYTTQSYGFGFKYNYINNGKKINIGDCVDIYINNEIQNFQTLNDKCYIKDKEWRYIGKRENMPLILSPGKYALNEMNENFIDLAKNLIVYEGFFESVD